MLKKMGGWLGNVMETVLAVGVQCLMLAHVSATYSMLRRSVSPPPEEEVAGDVSGARLSVVIPAYREEGRIGSTMKKTAENAVAPELLELVVVDGGGGDRTEDEARHMADTLPVRVVVTSSTGGRGPAVAAGARAATGDVLLVLHADTELPPGFDAEVKTGLHNAAATAFRFAVHRATIGEKCVWPYLIMEHTVNLRAGFFQLPFGDQAIALRKSLFIRLGGLDDLARVPILEDFLLVQRLRRLPRSSSSLRSIALLASSAQCDGRRWLASSVWRVNLVNQAVMLLHTFAGYDPPAIFRLYYGRDPPPLTATTTLPT